MYKDIVWRPWHLWVDYAWPNAGNIIDVYNCADGKVIKSGRDTSWFGLRVVVQVGNRQIYYCHLSEIDPAIKVGMFLSALSPIGKMWETGNTRGVHLHLGIKSNEAGNINGWINPEPFIKDWADKEYEPLVADSIKKWYWNWVEKPMTMERITLLVRKAIEWEHNELWLWKEEYKVVQGYKNLNDFNDIIPVEDIPDGDIDEWFDNVTFVEDRFVLSELKAMFPRAKTNYYKEIMKNKKLQLNQDELKRKSKWCTVYNNLASATHYWINFTIKQREQIIKRYIKQGLIGENKGGSTLKVSMHRERCLKELWLYKGDIDTYVFKAGSFSMAFVLWFRQHYFVMGTVMSSDFGRDRWDNHIVDGKVHWWIIHGGHSHWLFAPTTEIAMWTNSYYGRKNNHALMLKNWGYGKFMFDRRPDGKRYVREAAAVHIYR